jgi:UDP-3-O-[3-hydroxymyristoyl] glucosamine N-acyltransferase
MNLKDIADKIGGVLIGPDLAIQALSSLADIQEDSLIFITAQSRLQQAEDSQAAAIVVPNDVTHSKKPIIQVGNPKIAFYSLISDFYPTKPFVNSIAKSAVIAENVQLPAEVSIGENVVIGEGCLIGERAVISAGVVLAENVRLAAGVHLHPNVTVYANSQIGEDSIVHANSVIGSDGFGYAFDGQKHQKIPHVGIVEIGKNVEIGANSVIDRGTLGKTIIKDGSKIDNLVQVAHNVELGENNIVCALSGIAGSSKTGNNVVMAANVGIADHVTIEENVMLGARTGVAPGKTIRAGSRMLGAPAKDERKAIEIVMLSQRLPQMRKSLQDLQKRIKELEKAATTSEE